MGRESIFHSGEFEINSVFSGLDESKAKKICKTLGYEEYGSDTVRSAAISLLPLAGNIHIFGYFSLFDDDF